MCGRFALGIPRKRLRERFEPGRGPRGAGTASTSPRASPWRPWSRTPHGRRIETGCFPGAWRRPGPREPRSMGAKLINARAETACV